MEGFGCNDEAFNNSDGIPFRDHRLKASIGEGEIPAHLRPAVFPFLPLPPAIIKLID
jgi:hypothetical protein